MTGSQIGIVILGLVVAAIVIAIVVWLMNWLYLRSSKERAFVRTGLGGQKVVMNGGAFVVPIAHEVVPVNMNTLRLEVSRGRDKALITKDRMRVDVVAEFYVRVQASTEAIAAAAQTLGQRTLEPETLKELVEGKFVDALRTVAAETTMEEMHEKRGEYVKRVKGVVAADLLQNGLELEAVSLTQFDQTAMEYFNPSNAFDAEGLTRLTEQIERRKKIRNDIEQDTMIQVRNKNLETERQALEIDRELEYARLAQERELEMQRASQRADVARQRADKEQEAERAQIGAREAVDRARLTSERAVEEERILKEREVEELEIARRQAVELAEQHRAIAVAEQSRAQSDAQAAADLARARAVTEEERVFTARETEMAERRKRIELIGAQQEAERDALRIRIGAEAERAAAGDRGAAVRAEAEALADADRVRSRRGPHPPRGGGGGQRLMNEAQNLLTPEARLSAMRIRLIDKLEGIVRESVKPLERIEGIRILQVDGLGGGGGGRGDGGNGGSLADNVVNSALRFRAQAPLVDQLLREIGVDAGDVGKLARGLLDRGPAAALPRAARATPGTASCRDQGLRLERHRRPRRPGLGGDPRLQRAAEVDAVRGRVPDRGRDGPRHGGLRAELPPEGRRGDPRAAPDPVRLRLPGELLDPGVPAGRRQLRGDAQAHAGDRRRPHLRRVVGRVRLRPRARGRAGADDRAGGLPGGVRRAEDHVPPLGKILRRMLVERDRAASGAR